MKTRLDLYSNTAYKPGNKVKLIVWYLINRLFFNTSFPYPNSFKAKLLKWFGSSVGTGVIFKPHVNIKYPWFLTIGNHVWIGEKVWIDNLAQVNIDDHVCISQQAMLLCGNHNYKKDTFDLMLGEINIQEGAWIGAKSIVCPGVTIHSHAILTVGSVATSSLDPNTIYQGNPAKIVRERHSSNQLAYN
ncbi:colanic acid biosynthesis acetyltransferase WcaF [Echinicola pacifica]|uniref:Colanic acid biosynthesis acetyltransferase WcaF n=1 Tax=Echinicola pacifica TaxID=346377 RepID=A0A918PMA8_9BACT|nr:WcaF family extracellular polysaccharide biosynthesis acetyltransferase [Echinicola pacifica]GGZ15436.1 colanic acid biosynthesis acetyltransferase WcaF [Echinicola pacifica]